MSQSISRTSVPLLSLSLLLGVAACSAPQPIVRQAGDAVTRCDSVGWRETEAVRSLADQQVRRQVLAGLEARGYSPSDSPGCLLDAEFIRREARVGSRTEPSIGVGMGGGSRGSFGGVGVTLPVGGRNGAEGTFVLRVIDAESRNEIWNGSIDTRFRSAQPSPEEAGALADQLLAVFPPRAGTTPAADGGAR